MKLLKFFAVALMAVLTSACAYSVPEREGSVRIMALGDSITAGYTDNPDWNIPFEQGYRSELYSLLVDAGYEIQFVGESQEPWDGRWEVPTNTPTFDLREIGQDRHRGYGAWWISDLSENIEAFIETDQPDVILLMVGINGIDADSPGQLKVLVQKIFTSTPDVKLIVAQITPYAWFNEDLLNYNLYIRDDLVPAYAAQGHNISTVDLYSFFLEDVQDPTSITTTGHSNEINHPSLALYEQMARVWFDALKLLLDKQDGQQDSLEKENG